MTLIIERAIYFFGVLGFIYTLVMMGISFYDLLKVSSTKNANFAMVLFGHLRHDEDIKLCKKRHLKRTLGIVPFILILVVLTIIRINIR